MNIQQALAELGVRHDTLTAEEKRSLDDNGFLFLREMLSPDQIHQWTAWIDERARYERENNIQDGQREEGTERVANLIAKNPMFDACITHPRLLAAIAHVLPSEFHSFGVSSRSALPGSGEQEFHVDFKLGGVAPGDYYRCNSAWLLDDLTETNGATRVIPGSHRGGKVPADEMHDRRASHPHQMMICAPAGTVLIFNSHVWHSGTTNRTPRMRRVVHSYFRRLHPKEAPPDRTNLPPQVHARLSEAARHLLNA